MSSKGGMRPLRRVPEVLNHVGTRRHRGPPVICRCDSLRRKGPDRDPGSPKRHSVRLKSARGPGEVPAGGSQGRHPD